MTLRKIILEGFLCYRSRQEMDLSDMTLCMLRGANGSGKSSAFDAVTFVFFGAHRAGKSGYGDLIHARSDAAAAECEFELLGECWRARRTLKRAAKNVPSTVQISRFDTAAQRWEVVPDTAAKAGFDRWIAEHLGLTFETFTCSMLLRQGEADRLLSAAPKERFNVMAGIVNLERYQRLEARALEKCRAAGTLRDVLQQQIDAIAPVEDATLVELHGQITAARQTLDELDQQIEALQTLHIQCRQCADLLEKKRDVEARRAQLAAVITQRSRIEADWRRLAEFDKVLPLLNLIQTRNARLAECQETMAAHQLAIVQRNTDLARVVATHEAATAAVDALEHAIARHAATLQDLTPRHASLDKAIAAAERFEGDQRKLDRVERELAAFLDDPQAALTTAGAALAEMESAERALPLLRRLYEQRKKLRAARQLLEKAAADAAAFDEKGATALQQCHAAREKQSAGEAALQLLRAQVTRAQAQLELAQQALEQVRHIDGKLDCPACGQPLTPQHRSAEIVKRAHAVKTATLSCDEIQTSHQHAEAALRPLAQAHQQFIDQSTRFADQGRAAAESMRQAQREISHFTHECTATSAQLEPSWRSHLQLEAENDWPTDTWPTEADVMAIAVRVSAGAAVRQRLAAAQQTFDHTRQLTMERNFLRQTLAERPIYLPANPDALRAEFAQLRQQLQAANAALETDRAALKAQTLALKQSQQEQAKIVRRVQELGHQFAQESLHADHARSDIDAAAQSLPENWATEKQCSAAALQQWELEHANLRTKGIAAQWQDLQKAGGEIDLHDARLHDLHADMNRLPEAARQDPASIAAEIARKKSARQTQEAASQHAQRRLEQLTENRENRNRLLAAHAAADRDCHRCKLLAELLGRNHLQRHLIRRAEHAIVQHANVILDRLSAGELALRLRGEGDEDASESALSLEAINRKITSDATPVEFQSGSQRFRIAVSLALAIGQFAAGSRAACGTVIIDEGFGSLDREGQDVMVRELHKLKGLLKRIVVVSHQESFADAFEEGYRLELIDGETRVTRLQR